MSKYDSFHVGRDDCNFANPLQNFTGLGVGMVRDSATVMLNQYFKRRRALVEIFLGIGNGLGILLSSPVMFYLLR